MADKNPYLTQEQREVIAGIKGSSYKRYPMGKKLKPIIHKKQRRLGEKLPGFMHVNNLIGVKPLGPTIKKDDDPVSTRTQVAYPPRIEELEPQKAFSKIHYDPPTFK